MKTGTIKITDEHYDLLMKIGDGSISLAVNKLLSRSKYKGDNTADPERVKEGFIEEYLEITGSDKDVIPAVNIYLEYLAYEVDRTPLGKGKFNHLLRTKGFKLENGPSNVLTIYGIKSNWL